MCGIAGLQITNPDLRPRLGEFLVPMLGMLAGRGPDSTGVAIYNDDAPPGMVKYSLRAPRDGYDWDGLARAMSSADNHGAGDGTGPPEVRRRGRDAVLVTERGADHVRDLLASIDSQVRVFGFGADGTARFFSLPSEEIITVVAESAVSSCVQILYDHELYVTYKRNLSVNPTRPPGMRLSGTTEARNPAICDPRSSKNRFRSAGCSDSWFYSIHVSAGNRIPHEGGRQLAK